MTMELKDPMGRLRRLQVRAGAPQRLVLVASVDASTEAILASRVRLTTRLTSSDGRTVVHEAEQPSMGPGLHEPVRFTHRGAPADTLQSLAARFVVPESTFTLRQPIELVFETTVRSLPRLVASAGHDPRPQRAVTGIVHGVDGKPAAKVPVMLLDSGPQPLQRTQTDDDGRFRLEPLAAGQYTVRAGGGDQGLASVPAAVAEFGSVLETTVALQLHQGLSVRGYARDQAGQPVAEAEVEWRAADGSWVDFTSVQPDGSFVLCNLPTTTGSLVLLAKDAGLPLAYLPTVLADSGVLLLTVAPAGGSALHGEAVAGDTAAPPRLRLWHADTGFGRDVPRPEAPRAPLLVGLLAGCYDVVASRDDCRGRPLGRYCVDGAAPLDLGRVELPEPAELAFTIADELQPETEAERQVELLALQPDADVRIELGAPAAATLRLPAGDYALLWRRRGGGLGSHRFQLHPGRSTTVGLGR
jgi:5-hydroxyisourate hydrolase-like protein (transthyretin family)